MKIKEYTAYNETEVLDLYASVGWSAYTNHPESLQKGFENSLLTLAAWDDTEQLIGIIRTVGDGSTIVFIQDLLVHPAHQRKGVGTALLQTVLDTYRHVRQIELVTDSSPKSASFYRALGLRELSEIGCRGFSV